MTDTSLKCAVLEAVQTAHLKRLPNCPFFPLLTVTISNKRTMNTAILLLLERKGTQNGLSLYLVG